ncbi:E4, partial [Macaca fascicularis papillomavirus 6]
NILTLCLALPSARDYPLLKLLADCQTPKQPIRTTTPTAPKKTGPRCSLQSDFDRVNPEHQTQSQPLTITLGDWSLELFPRTQNSTVVLIVHQLSI